MVYSRIHNISDQFRECHNVLSPNFHEGISTASGIRALEADFLHTNPREKKTVSQEDIQFLQLLNKKFQDNNKGHHTRIPLPFWSRPCLPKNKRLAKVHLKHQKAEYEKSSNFRKDYIQFMDFTFEDGDAKEANDAGKDGNT